MLLAAICFDNNNRPSCYAHVLYPIKAAVVAGSFIQGLFSLWSRKPTHPTIPKRPSTDHTKERLRREISTPPSNQ